MVSGGAVQERSLQCRLPSTARKVISALEALRPLAHLVSTRMNSARQSAKSAPPATNARARTKPLWNAARCTTVQLLKQIPPSAQTANTQRKRLPRSWTIAFNARPDTFVRKARLTRRNSLNVLQATIALQERIQRPLEALVAHKSAGWDTTVPRELPTRCHALLASLAPPRH